MRLFLYRALLRHEQLQNHKAKPCTVVYLYNWSSCGVIIVAADFALVFYISKANLWSSPHGFQATGSVGTSKVDRSASGKPDRSGGEVIGTIGLSSINPQPSYQAATSTLTIAPSPTASSVMLHPSGLDSFTTAASHLQHETQTPGFIYRSLQTTVLFTAPAIASKTRGEIHNESLTVSPSASLWQGTRSIVLTSGSGKNTLYLQYPRKHNSVSIFFKNYKLLSCINLSS